MANENILNNIIIKLKTKPLNIIEIKEMQQVRYLKYLSIAYLKTLF